jgi:hypothetical protein
MKKVIGGEISRNQPQVLDLTKSLNVLDLRKSQPQDKKEPPKPARPQPAELPLEPAPLPAPTPAAAVALTSAPAAKPEEPVQVAERSMAKATPNRRWSWRHAAGHLVRAVIVIAGAIFFLSLNIDLPERLIGIYFVASLVYAIDSQRTFLVALIFLVMVAIWSALGQNVPAENYAIYAFYFLVIGLVSALRELVVHKPKSQSNPSS